MAQKMMWDHILSVYRGQASDGTVVVAEPAAMDLAQRKAGRTVYDSDWWVETVQRTLEHWGIYSRRWIDAATRMPRINYSLTKYTGQAGSAVAEAAQPQSVDQVVPAPIRPLASGPLTNRIISGPLGPRDLERGQSK